MRFIERWRALASHHRVHAGILFALLYVALSRTSGERFVIGAAIVVVGEAIRVWACGYLVRNIERIGTCAIHCTWVAWRSGWAWRC